MSPSMQAWRMLKRLKWLFLSLFLIYAWMTPGAPLVTDWPFMPSREGLLISFERIGMLVLMVFLVDVFITHTERQDLIGGLYLFFKPLARVGINVKQLVLRAYLTMQAINVTSPEKPDIRPEFRAWARVMSQAMYQRFASSCEVNEVPRQIDIVLPRDTMWKDWLLPFSLIVLLLIVTVSPG